MKKAGWKKRIIEQMISVGTYDEAFTPTIETCAIILERRDLALQEWKDDGCRLTIIKTQDRGAQNPAKNPLLAILQECEKDALSYWSALGLTPASLKKTFADERKNAESKKGSALVEALKALSA